jgi:hypothetical protein
MTFFRFWYGEHTGIVQAGSSVKARNIVRDNYGHGLGSLMVKELEFAPTYVGLSAP